MELVYYFGCNNGPGHYMHSPGMRTGDDLTDRRHISRLTGANPWGYGIDGNLCPADPEQLQGRALLHYKDGWTAVAFWDRSVDHRKGSNSVFLAPAIHDFDVMMRLSKEAFSTVFDRACFDVCHLGTARCRVSDGDVAKDSRQNPYLTEVLDVLDSIKFR